MVQSVCLTSKKPGVRISQPLLKFKEIHHNPGKSDTGAEGERSLLKDLKRPPDEENTEVG